jgi:hypothetical protein
MVFIGIRRACGFKIDVGIGEKRDGVDGVIRRAGKWT